MAIEPITAILETGSTIIDKIWPDADEAEKRKLELATIAHSGDMARLQAEVKSLVGQLEINKQEASHKSIFVAGWRPAVGWICAAGLGWNFVLQPLISWIAFISGVEMAQAPSLDISELLTLLFGMLGLGAYRMREKEKGVASDSMKK